MIHWDFENAQPGARRFHLHLQVPAISLLAHIERFECIPPNGPKRRHVRITNPIEQSHNQTRKPSGEDLLKIHTAGFALSACSRADHKVMRSACDGINKLIY